MGPTSIDAMYSSNGSTRPSILKVSWYGIGPTLAWTALKATHPEVIRGHLMLGIAILPQSEVIRAILLKDSPCCGDVPETLDQPGFRQRGLQTLQQPDAAPHHNRPGPGDVRLQRGAQVADLPFRRGHQLLQQHVLAYSCSRDYPQGLQL